MPSSCRNSSRSRRSATESIPPETATPTRSPPFSRSCRRMWESTRSARECMGTCYIAKVLMWGQPPSAVRGAKLRKGSEFSTQASWRSPDGRRRPSHINHLHARAFLRDQLPDLLHKIRGQHVFRLFFPARPDIYLPRLSLFIPDNE